MRALVRATTGGRPYKQIIMKLNHYPRAADPAYSCCLSPRACCLLVMRVAAAMFSVAEDQRLDHHGHRFGIRQLLADVDEVEIF